MKHVSKIVLSGVAMLALVACKDGGSEGSGGGGADSGGSDSGGAGGSGGATTSSGGSGGAAISLNEGYKKATWGDGITVTYGDCTLRYQSNGLPNHARDAQYAVPNAGVMVPSADTAHAVADPTAAQSYDVTLDTCPTFAASVTTTSLGNIGYMISGASLFNPYEGDGTTVALASNFSVDDANGDPAYFVDACNGHPTPMGQYHYHGLPACVTAEVDTAGGPSHLIGIALDGFPVYGDRDASGNAITAADLDECNGLTSATPEFPGGVYHYVLLDTPAATSSIRCYKGKPAAAGSGGMGGPPGGMAPPGGAPPGGASAQELGPCGSGAALAQRDPSSAKRLFAGVVASLRAPFSF